MADSIPRQRSAPARAMKACAELGAAGLEQPTPLRRGVVRSPVPPGHSAQGLAERGREDRDRTMSRGGARRRRSAGQASAKHEHAFCPAVTDLVHGNASTKNTHGTSPLRTHHRNLYGMPDTCLATRPERTRDAKLQEVRGIAADNGPCPTMTQTALHTNSERKHTHTHTHRPATTATEPRHHDAKARLQTQQSDCGLSLPGSENGCSLNLRLTSCEQKVPQRGFAARPPNLPGRRRVGPRARCTWTIPPPRPKVSKTRLTPERPIFKACNLPSLKWHPDKRQCKSGCENEASETVSGDQAKPKLRMGHASTSFVCSPPHSARSSLRVFGADRMQAFNLIHPNRRWIHWRH